MSAGPTTRPKRSPLPDGAPDCSGDPSSTVASRERGAISQPMLGTWSASFRSPGPRLRSVGLARRSQRGRHVGRVEHPHEEIARHAWGKPCDMCLKRYATCRPRRHMCGRLYPQSRNHCVPRTRSKLSETCADSRLLVESGGDFGRLVDTRADLRRLAQTCADLREDSRNREGVGSLCTAVRGADGVLLWCPHLPSVAPTSLIAYIGPEKRVRTVNLLRQWAAGLHKAA
jgi:hypothetical protein